MLVETALLAAWNAVRETAHQACRVAALVSNTGDIIVNKFFFHNCSNHVEACKSTSTKRHGTSHKKFLIELVLGAETVLARLLHEVTATRMCSPNSRGKILKSRAFASTDLVNKLAAKRINTV